MNPSKKFNSNSRYRDYDIFKYWFRSVSEYAPWVNKIFLVTDNQIPNWLDSTNEKIVCVNHSDYINARYLPTFNSNAIELNLNRIPNLSENFVLFNDDTFLNNCVTPENFFIGDVPVDSYIESPIISTRGSIANIMVNDMSIINDFFSKKEFYKKNWAKVFNPRIGPKILRTLALLPSKDFSGIWNSHLPVPYNKETFNKMWDSFSVELNETTSHKFRTSSDYSHWLMRYWQLVSGNYSLQNRHFGKAYDLGDISRRIIKEEIINGKHKIICLNDTDNVKKFEEVKNNLKLAFDKKFPNKCEFEI